MRIRGVCSFDMNELRRVAFYPREIENVKIKWNRIVLWAKSRHITGQSHTTFRFYHVYIITDCINKVSHLLKLRITKNFHPPLSSPTATKIVTNFTILHHQLTKYTRRF